jgi:DNA modification methylase
MQNVSRRQGVLFPDLLTSVSSSGEPISRQRLPTNTSNRYPVHRWFNFIAGFSPEFVSQCIQEIPGTVTSLLDPFAGCGTAPLVARQMGLRAFGFEPHPIFVRVARAKLSAPLSHDCLAPIGRAIMDGIRKPDTAGALGVDARVFLSKLFDQTTLEELLGARAALTSNCLHENDLAFLTLSRIVEMSSHSQTDGIYKAPTSTRKHTPPLYGARHVLRMIAEDLEDLRTGVANPPAVMYEHSSTDMRRVPDSSIDVVVTSPPYLNNFDYAEMTRMLLYFWGIASSWGEITNKVRSRLIVNTTTALKGHKERQLEYREAIPHCLRRSLDLIRTQLASLRTQRAGRKDYDLLVYPYFGQMTKVLRECFRCMRPGAPIHIMVADAALYGVHISTPQFLTEIMEVVGFRNCACELVRKRGERWILQKREGSKIGLGEYHVSGAK